MNLPPGNPASFPSLSLFFIIMVAALYNIAMEAATTIIVIYKEGMPEVKHQGRWAKDVVGHASCGVTRRGRKGIEFGPASVYYCHSFPSFLSQSLSY